MPTTNSTHQPNTAAQAMHISISNIFQQVQSTVNNHRKNYVTLHKIHMEAAEVVEAKYKGVPRLVGEKQFRDVFMLYLLRAMPIKKGTTAADCVLKFVGGYIKFMNEKAIEEKANQASEEEEDEDDDDTTAARFTAFLLFELLKGCMAKDKNVRYRVLYTILEMIAHLGTIDVDTYEALLEALKDRINDKEASIRSIAATCLARLALSDDSETGEETLIMDKLLEALSFDSSAEVRRATLMNIPLNDRTLPAVLDRTRDTDQSIRKLVYGHILDKNMLSEESSIGSTHPKVLSIAQREIIVKNGLGDRDITVKSAASMVIAKWMDVVNVNVEEQDVKPESDTQERVEDKLLAFISLFDLNTGITVACDALQSVFSTRPDISKKIEFGEKFWNTLGFKEAFLVRVFAEHCKAIKDEARLEATLPVVTSIAFRIRDAYNQFADFQRNYNAFYKSEVVDEDESNKKQEENFEKELHLSELLKLAIILDYSDEIGRRKMFDLVRDMLRAEILPEAVMGACLDVLRELSTNERDLIRLVVETVQELRYNIINSDQVEAAEEEDDQERPESTAIPQPSLSTIPNMTPEQQARLDIVDSKCLTMCIGMLERVNSTFEENITLDGVLKDLIIPSVQKQDGILREKGTKALALCCLIARRLAIQTFKIFINNIPTSPPNIRLTLAQALFDIFMVHKDAIFKDETNLEMITMFLLAQIRNEQDSEVQAIFCQGTAKLVISRIITDIEAVKTLLKAYISPSTAGNTGLRQALNLFFDLYSLHSSLENQQRMREIFILIFLDLCEDRRNAVDDDDTTVLESVKITSMFLGWTDPLQVSKAINAKGFQDGKLANECIQLDMARDIITLLFEKDLKIDIEKEDKRVLCQLLNKLYIPDTVDDYRIRSLKLLMTNLRTRRPLRDTVCKTAFAKFEATVTKKFEKQLEHFSEEEFRKLEELNELFMFLDSLIPLDDEESDIPWKTRKRRSESIISTATESRSNSPAARRKNKPKNKRPRLSTSGNDDDDDDEEESTGLGTPKPTAPTRTLPKRAAASRKPIIESIVISSDSEEWHEPGPSSRMDKGKPGSRARFRPSVKQEFEEAQVDRDFDSLLDNNSSTSSGAQYDSIMGPDDSEEEEEVNDLLAED